MATKNEIQWLKFIAKRCLDALKEIRHETDDWEIEKMAMRAEEDCYEKMRTDLRDN